MVASDSEGNAAAALRPRELSLAERCLVLAAAFLGWMFAGLEMNVYPLAARPAILHFLSLQETSLPSAATPPPAADDSTGDDGAPEVASPDTGIEEQVGRWFSWYICAFLLGAAAGGLLFGWLGDRIGRVRAMTLSILCYSLVTGVSYFANSLEQLLWLRFIACLGIGGMWPNGVALVSEAWSNASRPLLAGLIGTAANVGFVVLAVIAKQRDITPEEWRWVMLVGAAPALLAVFVHFTLPESPHWELQKSLAASHAKSAPVVVVFRPPFLKLTVVGILLGTVPLLGGWGTLNWIIPWSDQAAGPDNPGLKATTSIMRSSGAALGSLIGGWLASLFGRRATYFSVSLLSLVLSGAIFWTLDPGSRLFLPAVFAIGFVGTIFFGWLPLYLPELFPTSVRATGTGVTFNFGRILSAAGVLGAGELMSAFNGDYAQVGRITHLIYALGMLVILFAPDTSGRRMEDE